MTADCEQQSKAQAEKYVFFFPPAAGVRAAAHKTTNIYWGRGGGGEGQGCFLYLMEKREDNEKRAGAESYFLLPGNGSRLRRRALTQESNQSFVYPQRRWRSLPAIRDTSGWRFIKERVEQKNSYAIGHVTRPLHLSRELSRSLFIKRQKEGDMFFYSYLESKWGKHVWN